MLATPAVSRGPSLRNRTLIAFGEVRTKVIPCHGDSHGGCDATGVQSSGVHHHLRSRGGRGQGVAVDRSRGDGLRWCGAALARRGLVLPRCAKEPACAWSGGCRPRPPGERSGCGHGCRDRLSGPDDSRDLDDGTRWWNDPGGTPLACSAAVAARDSEASEGGLPRRYRPHSSAAHVRPGPAHRQDVLA
jgi:hypothetical protein